MEFLAILISLAILAIVGMAITDKAGIEKLVWNVSSPITLDGDELAPEDELAIERLVQKSARGTETKQGNKRVEVEIKYRDPSIASSIETEDGNMADLEIWQLGSSSADETVPSLGIQLLREVIQMDPEAEEGSHLVLKIYRTWN